MTLIISGHPRPNSRTLRLATSVAHAVAHARGEVDGVVVGEADGEGVGAAVGEAVSAVGAADLTVIDVSTLGPRLIEPDGLTAELAAIAEADVLVVATPTYKATFTGVLKVLLDVLDHHGLAGKTAYPVITAGSPSQADRAAAALTTLLTELAAEVRAPFTITEPALTTGEGVDEAIAAYVRS